MLDQVVEDFQIPQEVLLRRDNNTALDFITIATTGNSQDFGSLTNARYWTCWSFLINKRTFYGWCSCWGTNKWITILSTGDAIDFGDLTRSPEVMLVSLTVTEDSKYNYGE